MDRMVSSTEVHTCSVAYYVDLLNLVNISIVANGDCFTSFLTDPIRVGYECSVYTTDEGQGVVELCAIIYDPPSGGAPRPFFIFASTNGTAGTCVGHLSDGSTGL